MKTREMLVIAVLILVVGFGVGRWSTSSPSPNSQDQKIAEIFKLIKETRRDQAQFERKMEPLLIEIEAQRLDEIRRNSINVLMWPSGEMQIQPTDPQNRKLDKLWDQVR
ncbi:MAG TPA: hypothetical protein VLG69_03745 [Candidatus Andersenbacteria bacterium]|nr:hypothetical protein [Candidatus Andersenbacteria bacterium]